MAKRPSMMLIIELISHVWVPEKWLIDDAHMDAIKIIRDIMKGDKEVTRKMRDDIVNALNEVINESKSLSAMDIEVIGDALKASGEKHEAEAKAKAEAETKEDKSDEADDE